MVGRGRQSGGQSTWSQEWQCCMGAGAVAVIAAVLSEERLSHAQGEGKS